MSEEIKEKYALEIYKERYAVWRHLETLRWTLSGISMAVLAGTVSIIQNAAKFQTWPVLLVSGLIFLMIAYSFSRISLGIVRNGQVLRRAGEIIGDDLIPVASNSMKTANGLFFCFLMLLGTIFSLAVVVALIIDLRILITVASA